MAVAHILVRSQTPDDYQRVYERPNGMCMEAPPGCGDPPAAHEMHVELSSNRRSNLFCAKHKVYIDVGREACLTPQKTPSHIPDRFATSKHKKKEPKEEIAKITRHFGERETMCATCMDRTTKAVKVQANGSTAMLKEGADTQMA